MSIFGQVWLWSLAAFVVGALLSWLLLARPAHSRVKQLERQLATGEGAPFDDHDHQGAAVAGLAGAGAGVGAGAALAGKPERTRVRQGLFDNDDDEDDDFAELDAAERASAEADRAAEAGYDYFDQPGADRVGGGTAELESPAAQARPDYPEYTPDYAASAEAFRQSTTEAPTSYQPMVGQAGNTLDDAGYSPFTSALEPNADREQEQDQDDFPAEPAGQQGAWFSRTGEQAEDDQDEAPQPEGGYLGEAERTQYYHHELDEQAEDADEPVSMFGGSAPANRPAADGEAAATEPGADGAVAGESAVEATREFRPEVPSHFAEPEPTQYYHPGLDGPGDESEAPTSMFRPVPATDEPDSPPEAAEGSYLAEAQRTQYFHPGMEDTGPDDGEQERGERVAAEPEQPVEREPETSVFSAVPPSPAEPTPPPSQFQPSAPRSAFAEPDRTDYRPGGFERQSQEADGWPVPERPAARDRQPERSTPEQPEPTEALRSQAQRSAQDGLGQFGDARFDSISTSSMSSPAPAGPSMFRAPSEPQAAEPEREVAPERETGPERTSMFEPPRSRFAEPEPRQGTRPKFGDVGSSLGAGESTPRPMEPVEPALREPEQTDAGQRMYAFGSGGEAAAEPPGGFEAATETTQVLPKRQPQRSLMGGLENQQPHQPSMRPVERRQSEGGPGHTGSLFEPMHQPATEMPKPPPARRGRLGGGAPPSVPAGPFGPGSAMPKPGGARPNDEFTVKASVTALRYCTDESPQFPRMVAEVWFRTAADAERVGFRPIN